MEYLEYEDFLSNAHPQFDEELFTYEHPNLTATDTDLEAILTEARDQERNRIETALEQIDQQLQERNKIHDQTVESFQQALRDERDRLERVSQPSTPADRIQEQRRRIHELEQQLHEQRRAHWRDRESLESERRQLRRNLAELEDTDLLGFL